MRSLLLASVVMLVTAGAASAQITPMASAPGTSNQSGTVAKPPASDASPKDPSAGPAGPNAPMSSPGSTGVGGGTTAGAPSSMGGQSAVTAKPPAAPTSTTN